MVQSNTAKTDIRMEVKLTKIYSNKQGRATHNRSNVKSRKRYQFVLTKASLNWPKTSRLIILLNLVKKRNIAWFAIVISHTHTRVRDRISLQFCFLSLLNLILLALLPAVRKPRHLWWNVNFLLMKNTDVNLLSLHWFECVEILMHCAHTWLVTRRLCIHKYVHWFIQARTWCLYTIKEFIPRRK